MLPLFCCCWLQILIGPLRPRPLFSFRIQNFPHPHISVFKSNFAVHTCPTDTYDTHPDSTQDSSGNSGNRACVEVAILNQLEYSIHDKELGSILLRHGIKKYPDLASARFRIHSVFKNFHSGERIQKVADSSAGFTGYVWTEAESAKKKLRIQKYPAKCGRGRWETYRPFSNILQLFFPFLCALMIFFLSSFSFSSPFLKSRSFSWLAILMTLLC